MKKVLIILTLVLLIGLTMYMIYINNPKEKKNYLVNGIRGIVPCIKC
jgi:uncharacterized protein YxeA